MSFPQEGSLVRGTVESTAGSPVPAERRRRWILLRCGPARTLIRPRSNTHRRRSGRCGSRARKGCWHRTKQLWRWDRSGRRRSSAPVILTRPHRQRVDESRRLELMLWGWSSTAQSSWPTAAVALTGRGLPSRRQAQVCDSEVMPIQTCLSSWMTMPSRRGGASSRHASHAHCCVESIQTRPGFARLVRGCYRGRDLRYLRL